MRSWIAPPAARMPRRRASVRSVFGVGEQLHRREYRIATGQGSVKYSRAAAPQQADDQAQR